MELDMMINLISNFGFPIFMVLWFMFKTEKSIKSNTEAIRVLTQAIKEHKF